MISRLIVVLALSFIAQAQSVGGLDVSVIDEGRQPVPTVRLELKRGADAVGSALTDEKGHAAFSNLPPGHYRLTLNRDGLEPLEREIDVTAGQGVALEITAVASLARRDTVEVSGKAAPVDQGATAPAQVDGRLAKENRQRGWLPERRHHPRLRRSRYPSPDDG